MAHKILLVDDDRINISLLKFTLAEKRYEVFVASDGEEGIEFLKSKRPDLVVLDVQMPKMNGFEFMNELKMLEGVDTTPVIMLTANETMEDMFKLEGVKAYYVKPVHPPTIISKIKEILGENPIE